MLYVYSQNRRKVESFRKKFPAGAVRGCSVFSQLTKIPERTEGTQDLCLIMDANLTPQQQVHLVDAFTGAPFRTAIYWTDKPVDGDALERNNVKNGNFSWSIVNKPDMIDFFQRAYTGAPAGRWRLIGQSPRMDAVRKQILQAGACDGPVHVFGETGTGKEIAAHLIHAARYGLNGPAMVSANCSEFQGQLAPCSLFGVSDGAYTDAKKRDGLAKKADGSSLFLDELEALAPTVQPLLLRLLESGTYYRVGATEAEHSSFRLITASNEDLGDLVRHDRLRKDLYYRLSGFSLTMPPLREHREDIPLLVGSFLERKGERRSLERGAMEALLAARWPGNVRELYSVLQCSLARSIGLDEIRLDLATLHAQESFDC